MATKRNTLRYGFAAVVIALAVIGSSLYLTPAPVSGSTDFVVMLTDPPTVPDGTTSLMVTYTSIQVHVKYAGGTSEWKVSQTAGGQVDLLSLLSDSLTIASLSLPSGAVVDKVQFTITDASITIGQKTLPVEIVSNQLIFPINDTTLTGATTGVLIDIQPRVIQVDDVDANGQPVSYYVLLPSATAVVKKNVSESQRGVGNRNKLSDDDNDELEQAQAQASMDLSIVEGAAKTYVKIEADSKTKITVTLKNEGAESVVVRGLAVFGDFTFSKQMPSNSKGKGNEGGKDNDHPRAIPFLITSGGALVPRMGDDHEHGGLNSGYEILAGGTATFTFEGVLGMGSNGHGNTSPTTITGTVGNVYSIRIDGQTLDVTAS